MSEVPLLISRPPLGFVVEGDGEYYSYPSLVARLVGARGFKIPIANAGGCGAIVKDLARQLRTIVLSDHPYSILVTLDLADVLDERMFPDCRGLLSSLEQQAQTWATQAAEDPRLLPLPERISIILQVPMFESWAIADHNALTSLGYRISGQFVFSNVDLEVPNPQTWLAHNVSPRLSLKNPRVAKSVISALNIDVMHLRSRSFRKFAQEVSSAYSDWFRACGIA